MPRTHELLSEDLAATAAEFTGQYGIHPNAEALLAAHQAAVDPALEAASMKQINPTETDKLKLESIEPSRGGVVLAAAVRGNAVTYVAEGEDGRVYKGVQAHNKNYAEPKQDVSDIAVREDNIARTRQSEMAARVNANIEAKVNEFRKELHDQAAEVLAKVAEDAQKDAEKNVSEAEKEAAKGDKTGTKESPSKGQTPEGDPKQGSGPKQAKGEK